MSDFIRDNDKILGAGTYGSVVSGTFKHPDGKITKAAMKIMERKCDTMGFFNIAEIEILTKLKGTLVPELYYVQTEPYTYSNGKISNEFLSIIFEKADMDGHKFIHTINYGIDIILKLASELLIVIDFMHKRKIFHCDIKPGNVLITFDEQKIPSLKLCDFGFSRYISRKTKRPHGISTLWYRDPAVFWDTSDYKCTADIWSIGSTLYEFAMKENLFRHVTEKTSLVEYMEFCLTKIPCKWTEKSQRQYRKMSRIVYSENEKIIDPSNPENISYKNVKKNGNDIKIFGSSEIRDIPQVRTSFMDKFRTSKSYRHEDDKKWKNLDNILISCFDFDYIQRLRSEEILKSSNFIDQRTHIDTLLEKQNFEYFQDAITIDISEELNNKKIIFFQRVLDEMPFVDYPKIFHAIDLANTCLTMYPDKNHDLQDIFSCCLYYFEKYYSITSNPSPAERFFFDKYKNGLTTDQHRELDELIYYFDSMVTSKESLVGFNTFRPGLFEMQDFYNHELSYNKLNTLVIEFCKITKWYGKSYRYMYRFLFNKLFDKNFKV